MGSQIAGLLADRGIPCELLDLRTVGDPERLAESARERLKSLRPPPVASVDALELIRPGNFDDHLDRLGAVDWVIEAVTEDLQVKRRLWSRIAPYLRSDVIISTNTSGIPVSGIATALPPALRPRFLGAHFCNPPRYLPLLEIISTQDTDAEVAAVVADLAENSLGRGVVRANDTPNFIANRAGAFALMAALKAMEEFGLAPDEVDGITGAAMGRPRSATFRTLDIMGVDVFAAIADNSRAAAEDPLERDLLTAPGYLRELVRRGWTGQKAGQGFYRRVGNKGDGQILTLDLSSFEYRPRKKLTAASLGAVTEIGPPGERVRALLAADGVAGPFAWRVLSRTLAYSAKIVGRAADDIVSVDRAMRWGYGWEIGPFEAWDAIGLAGSLQRMVADGLTVPGWITRLAASESDFYRRGSDGAVQATPDGEYAEVPLARLGS